MIDVNDIRVLKEQFTPTAFPLLLTQEDTLDPLASTAGVVLESLAPGEEITVRGTGCTFHFAVLLDVRLAVVPSLCRMCPRSSHRVLWRRFLLSLRETSREEGDRMDERSLTQRGHLLSQQRQDVFVEKADETLPLASFFETHP